MKKYSVIQSETGEVGYPKGFDTKEDAQKFFDECKGGAILIRRCRFHESILETKGLSDDAVDALLG